MILFLAFFLFILALILFWWGRRKGKSAGLPVGRIVYADTGLFRETPEPLFDRRLRLAGKPDYLIHRKDEIIPVEVKTTRVSSAPYDAHIYQLMAYCLLVESAYGKRPSCGYLHYPNRTFVLEYSSEMETRLIELIDVMRSKLRRKNVPRSHQQPRRCARCGYRSICDERMEG